MLHRGVRITMNDGDRIRIPAPHLARYWKYGPEPLRPTAPKTHFGKSTRDERAKTYSPGQLNKPAVVSPGPARYVLAN